MNGAWRRIFVTNRIPFVGDKPIAADFPDKGGVWLSVFEKAYMYLQGTYNWHGGYAELDIYILTGWIPQVRNFADTFIDGKETEQTLQKEKSLQILLKSYNELCPITFSSSINHSYYLESLSKDDYSLVLYDPLSHEQIKIKWDDLWDEFERKTSKKSYFFDRFSYNVNPMNFSFRAVVNVEYSICVDKPKAEANPYFAIVSLETCKKIFNVFLFSL